MWHYEPSIFLRSGLIQTLYVALFAHRNWHKTIEYSEPNYQEHIFYGANNVPIYGLVAIPPHAQGTIIATYGVTGSLQDQWFLKILSAKAYAQNYAVVMFDWRAHGKTALLSPTLTSDGLYEGQDFLCIASQSKKLGCPPQFWFTGYSLGGKLTLWALYEASHLSKYEDSLELSEEDIGGGCAICPSLDAWKSLNYLETHPVGSKLEKAITRNLRQLAEKIFQAHPHHFNQQQLDRVNSIKEFDRNLVIPQLGIDSLEEYYRLSSPLQIMPQIKKPTLILYAKDDPMFAPCLIEEVIKVSKNNPCIDLTLTKYGGHVGYISSKNCQKQWNDQDKWWAWNRFLEWITDSQKKKKK